ncbi:MAG: hypothetical protein MHPDNHAH_01603 [Anaerolineales bacterium]|nr:hypothetical protein [Anaerolineales bacterium]WKZ49379.1 MAG: hypothetical protein QY306_08410 [Anaerolineales bacterium]
MFKKPLTWLQRNWWGILVAYLIVSVTSYLAIWQLAEPLGLPDKIENFPSFVSSRIFIHLALTIIVAAYITLFLDVWLRYNHWKNVLANTGIISADTLKYQQLLRVLRRISHLQEEFSVNDWKIVYSIDEHGNELLLEELTITPSKEAIYFYYKGYSIPEGSSDDYQINVSAKNLADGTPLAVLELVRSRDKIHYTILLDPPSRFDQPKSIAIECKRRGIWKDLVNSCNTDGTLTTHHDSNELSIEFIAPLGRKWKAFHPAPLSIGESKIYNVDGLSRIKWHIPHSTPRTLAYEAFLEPENV